MWFMSKTLFIFGAFMIFILSVEILIVFMYPHGGGEILALFGEPRSANFHELMRVFIAYTGMCAAICVLLPLVRYPLPWYVVMILGVVIANLFWYRILNFPYQYPGFHRVCSILQYFIPGVVLAPACIVHALQLYVRYKRSARFSKLPDVSTMGTFAKDC